MTQPATGILFLCTGNSCRSQMAEGFARRLSTSVWSAGTDPVGVNPRAVQVMAELGIDLGEQSSKSLAGVPLEEVAHVVTLCGDARGCAVLPPELETTHWPIPDPADATGSEEEILAEFRRVRDDLARRIAKLFQTD